MEKETAPIISTFLLIYVSMLNFGVHYRHKSPTYHKSKMIAIGLHTYVLGAVKLLSPSTEQMEAIHHSGPIESFTCLLKNDIHYSVVSYRSGSLKRDDSICIFQDQNSIKYAEIELFAMKPMQCALVRELMPSATSIMDQAGPTCNTVLTTHRNSGLLNGLCTVGPLIFHFTDTFFVKANLIQMGLFSFVFFI